jgi:hypothetical protein
MDQTIPEDPGVPVRTEAVVVTHPVVRKFTKLRGKKGSRTSSRDERVSKSPRRLSRAIYHGVDTYIEHRDESKGRAARRRSLVENVSYGVLSARCCTTPRRP